MKCSNCGKRREETERKRTVGRRREKVCGGKEEVCGVKKEKRTLEEVGSGGNGKEEKGSERKVGNGKREITKGI